jgi:hypothetical protein
VYLQSATTILDDFSKLLNCAAEAIWIVFDIIIRRDDVLSRGACEGKGGTTKWEELAARTISGD